MTALGAEPLAPARDGDAPGCGLAVRVVPAAEAVPPGRIGYDLRAGALLLHTFVPRAAVEALGTAGRLTASDEHVEPLFEPLAYTWMRAQVREHLGQDTWPLWAWAKIPRRALIAEAVSHAGRGEAYLLTCRVPRQRVLLSHFVEWHCALNATPVPPVGLDDDGLDAFYDDWYDRLEAACPGWARTPRRDWPELVRRELGESWKAIFDVARFPRSSSWQACLTHLDAGDVVDVARLLR